jgi:uncharacterized protein YheU (UPF0270 family)
VRIPLSRLSQEVLDAIVEEFVTREGTDYSHRDYSLAEKRSAVVEALRDGRAEIVFDPDTSSIHIIDTRT